RRDAYCTAMWMRALLQQMGGPQDTEATEFIANRGLEIRAVATEGDSGSGGYLVPEPAEMAFIERREAVGVLRNLADRHVMTAESLTVPKLLTGPAVTYPGETGTGTASDQTWGQVRLTAAERMVLSYVSNRLRSDAAINIVDQFISRMAYEAAKQDDNEAVNGDGTSTYGRETGLLAALGAAGKATAATGHDTWPELDLDDMIAALAILPDEYWQNPVWLCSSAFYHLVMLRIQASAGGNTIATLEAGGSARPMFLGYPVYFTGRMPTSTAASTTCAIFGSINQGLMLGDRLGLQVATSEHVAFTSNQLAIRGVYRQDWNVHEGGDASDAGAYVGVVTAA
ncbi:MAG: phage major capsid protein, partial [Planctomycetales bacterium]|nr:phage major capsid protein [Planctomycetales bacterium]